MDGILRDTIRKLIGLEGGKSGNVMLSTGFGGSLKHLLTTNPQ